VGFTGNGVGGGAGMEIWAEDEFRLPGLMLLY
jgi:hypothetical protein